MSIVKMQKIAVIGLDEQKESLMTKLMDFGAIEPSDQKNKLADDEYKSLVTPDDGHVKAAELDAEINKAEAALRVLETFDTAREPLFKTRRTVGRDAVAKMRKEKEAAAEDVRRVLELEEKLRNTNDDINKLTQDEILLKPWQNYGVPLEVSKTAKTVVHMGVIPAVTEISEVAEKAEKDENAVVRIVSGDKDMNYIAVLCLASAEENVISLFKQNGFSEISFKGFEGTVSENLKRIEKEKDVLRSNIEEIKKQIAQMASMRRTIENYCDILSMEADKEKIKTKLLRTKKTFYM